MTWRRSVPIIIIVVSVYEEGLGIRRTRDLSIVVRNIKDFD